MRLNVTAENHNRYASAFAAALAGLGLDAKDGFLTAVSGGPDSTALALMAQSYADKNGKWHQALIVNHGLRADAGDEAQRVQARLGEHGIEARILTIYQPAPRAAIQEWARHHRHQILADAARKAGAVLLFAHHASDQAETIAMRLLKGSGLGGLGGIPDMRMAHDVIVARPLLSWDKAWLLAVCASYRCDFENDPSNARLMFERVRLRQMLAKMDHAGAEPIASPVCSLALRRLGVAAARLTSLLDAKALGLMSQAVTWHASGYADFSPDIVTGLPQSVWWRLMRPVILAIGGGEHGPSAGATLRLRARVDAGISTTVGGCHFSPVKTPQARPPRYRLFRETGRRHIFTPVTARQMFVFAGCWLVEARCDGVIHAYADLNKQANRANIYGANAHQNAKTSMPKEWAMIPYRARCAIPVLSGLDGSVFYPHLKGVDKGDSNAIVTARYLGNGKEPGALFR